MGGLRVVCLTGRPGGLHPGAVEELSSRLPGFDITAVPADRAEEADPAADCVISSGACPNLGRLPAAIPWVQIWGTGVEDVAPAVLETKTVSCTRGASAGPISEFVLAAILAFEKQLPEVWLSEPPEHWYRADLGVLAGTRLAIFGLGAIGQAVARLALAFGMVVTGMRRSAGPSPLDGVRTVGDLRSLADGARHLVVAAPATAATERVVNRSVFDAMAEGSQVINIARGRLIDHDDLRAALDSGRVARATLDTTDPEPLPDGHWLFSHPGARISPHVSWSSPRAQNTIIDQCVDNLRARSEGRPLSGLVDPAERY